MKPNELMFDDYITVAHTHRQPSTEKVYGIGQTHVLIKMSSGIYSFEYERIQPIPITEDFLLKNGFRKKEFKDHNVLMIFNLGMSIVKVETGWFINVSKANEHLHNFTEVSVIINYVHELQHILKLIGIEKEVTV